MQRHLELGLRGTSQALVLIELSVKAALDSHVLSVAQQRIDLKGKKNKANMTLESKLPRAFVKTHGFVWW